jgi:hypothetical protein
MDLNQRKLWNENHKKLTNIILKPNEHLNTIELFLYQHSLLHSSKVSNTSLKTLEDELMKDISEVALRKFPIVAPDTKNSIIWHLWHITRIEDMTMNILVAEYDQILYSGGWYKHLNTEYNHSGNGMTEDEIDTLSSNIDVSALLNYRSEVGRRTREIVAGLQPGDFKKKIEGLRIIKLKEQEAVKKEANWLLEYWGNKSVAGLILMPATRHNFLHLNKSIRIKQKLQKNKSIDFKYIEEGADIL